LSLWLQGGDQLSRHEYATSYRNIDQKTIIEAEEQVDGLDCVKLRCESWSGGALSAIRYLWLAKKRTYLPPKARGCARRYNKTIPLEVGKCWDFRELKPGIWLPFRCSLTIHDEREASENRQVVSNTEEWTIQRAELDPKHDISFFRNIEFPKGTP